MPNSTISSSAVNADLSDIAAGLTNALTKDGQTVPTANLPMGGQKHTGVAVASSRTDYARASQVIDGSMVYSAAGGTANALTATISPGIAAYALGQRFNLLTGAAANTAAVTLNVNAIGVGTVVWSDGAALVAGDLPIGAAVTVQVASIASPTAPVFHLQTQTRAPGSATTGTFSGNITVGGTAGITGVATVGSLVSGGISGVGDLSRESIDAGAAAGPSLNLFRNSASPAANDVIGEQKFSGKDSGGGTNNYARSYAVIIDPTAASEDGEFVVETVVAGTEAARTRTGAGFYTAGATGGDKGANTINTDGLYVAGIAQTKMVVQCSFNGTTGALIGSSLNVTSVTRVGAGSYTVNFTNNLPAATMHFSLDCVISAGNSLTQVNGATINTTAFGITCTALNSGSSTVFAADSPHISLTIWL